MKQSQPPKLNIAFVYDPKAHCLKQGYSASECGDLADDITINGISDALQSLGHHVIHIPGIKHLVHHLARGDQKDWDLVFNFGEGVTGSARESQVPALLEAYNVPFTFSDASTLALCIDKARTKMVLNHHNIPTSPFLVVPRFGEPVDYTVLEDQLPYPLFTKPVAASTSNGITASNKIQQKEKFRAVIEDIRSQFPEQEVLVETFLDGREFTVGILGTGEDARVLGVSEVTWYNPEGGCDEDGSVEFATIFSKSGGGADKDMGHTHVGLDGNDQMLRVSQVALDAYKALGCQDAGRVDVRFGPGEDEPTPYVIEVNPIFGLNPNDSLYTWIAKNNGLSYMDLLQRIIDNALSRYNSVKPH